MTTEPENLKDVVEDDEDVEGHRAIYMANGSDDDDDVEGHRVLR